MMSFKDVAEYFQQLVKPKEKPGAVGVYLSTDSICMVHFDEKILASQYIRCSSDIERQAALQTFVQDNNLATTPCHVIIELQDYKVTLLDTPPVAESEIIPSVRWMVKDAINYPLDEASVDVFPVPLARARDNMKLIYAVVAPIKKLLSIESMIKNTQLHLHSFSIVEMALRNALNYADAIHQSSLLIYLQNNIGRMLIIDKEAIYMVRNLDLKDNAQETVLLEIQRYMDYANTLFRRQLCTQIVFTPNLLTGDINHQIKATLDLNTETLPFTHFFPKGESVPQEEQAPLLVALGAALTDVMNARQPATEGAT